MLTILVVILGLSMLIIGHEAGHFFVAKLFKLKVEEFGFGLPPRIFGLRRYGGTTGGKWHFFWRERENQDAMKGLRPSDTVYSFNVLPFGGFVRIAGENDLPRPDLESQQILAEKDKTRLFFFQPAWKRGAVMLAGVTINFIIGWLLISAILMIGIPQSVLIAEVQKNSPAETAGLAAGDMILEYSGMEQFVGFVNSHKGEKIGINVMRAGQKLTFYPVPRTVVAPGEGAIGVLLQETGAAQQGFFSAIYGGLKQSLLVVKLTMTALYNLFINLLTSGSLSEGVMGPIGILGVAQKTGELGWIYILQILALISINLAAMNLIPFPALDGGRFFLILVERIKGSRVSFRVEAVLNGVGFLILLALMVAISIRDVIRLL